MKAIPGYSRLRATQDGRIFVVKMRGKTISPPQEIVGRPNNSGYIFCGVKADKDCDPLIATPGREGQLVHILVCLAFRGIRPTPRHEVDHINRDKQDNRPENLRWVTRKENCTTRVYEARPMGETHGKSKLTDEKVREIRRLRESGKTLKEIGAVMGVHLGCIHGVTAGKTWRRVE